MIDEVIAGFRCVNRSWSRVTAGLLRGQWAWVDAGFRTADRLLGAAADPAFPAGEAARPAAEGMDALVRRALERVGEGLPPPREIYDVKYRERIDWLRFPAWARPSDPEVFTGCCHEG
ncbi:MAG TPA: hypothetical protein VFE78_19165 [Gemmataceae bacterium]|jgi:hypothetical protein|nr:hypothetical protein [Gemmataceae bacterium]